MAIPRDDRIELIAEARGAVKMIDVILLGGLDEVIRGLLDFPDEFPEPPQAYMAHEWSPPKEKLDGNG